MDFFKTGFCCITKFGVNQFRDYKSLRYNEIFAATNFIKKRVDYTTLKKDSHRSADDNSLDENALSEVGPHPKSGKLGSEKSYPSHNARGQQRRPAPRHPNNIPPPPNNNNNNNRGTIVVNSDDASSGLLSHDDSHDTKRQNDLNRCNAVYSYEEMPKLITPPHVINLETSEL